MSDLDQYPEYCIVTCNFDCIDNLYTFGYKSSLGFSILTMLVAVYHLFQHFINFNNAYFQSKIISNYHKYRSYPLPPSRVLHRLHLLTHLFGTIIIYAD